MEYSYCIEGYPYRIRPVAFLAVERGVPQSVQYKFKTPKGAYRLPRLVWIEFKSCGNKVFPKNKCCGPRAFVDSKREFGAFQYLRLSSGEKAVLYYIAGVLFAMPNAVILVEDPEFYLHHSIMKSLWDSIENLRKDCTFVYLTHDFGFHSFACRVLVLGPFVSTA